MKLKTMIKQFSQLGVCLASLMTLDQAMGLTTADADKMIEVIHERLDDNVVGYQFAVMQGNGTILKQYAWGYSNVTLNEKMSLDAKINLGSVSKMVTTTTLLKLVDDGHINLYDPFYRYLDPVKFPYNEIHETVKQITVHELLTHTSQFDGGDCLTIDECRAILAKPRKFSRIDEDENIEYVTCLSNLEMEQSDSPYRCHRRYQNMNTHLLRFLIEKISGTKTVNQLVNYTQSLWMSNAGIYGMSCAADPNHNMRYYNLCSEASAATLKERECVDGIWYESEAWTESKYCSSGGWRASVGQMLTMLYELQHGNILSQELTNYLLDTQKIAANDDPGSTAAGWEPPWNPKYNQKALGKSGAIAGTRTYITLLPDDSYAVLLLNTSDNGKPLVTSTNPTSAVRNAFWK